MKLRWLAIGMALAAPAAAEGENPWFAQGRTAVAEARALSRASKPAKNVIVFLGDGMGLTTITAARILDGQSRGESGEENQLAFERLPHVCLVKTYNTNQQVPDSAGTMTAILSGAKTRAEVIGLDETVPVGDAVAAATGHLPSLIEQAEDRGLATGVITTARITHATPAAAFAHTPQRSWENDTQLSSQARATDFPDIARQLVEWPHGDGLDVVLGGGRQQLMPREMADPEYRDARGRRADGRDLIAEWRARHPEGRYVWNLEEFEAVDPAQTSKLLGLFQPDHMNFELDRANDPAGEPSLAQLTEKALAMLARNPKGYVLLVEGGRIDHAHHFGNAYRALVDTIAFSDAVRVAMQNTDADETLIVVTADHGHVMTLGGYPTRGNPILGKVVSNDRESGEPNVEFEKDQTGLPYTTIGYHNGPGARGPAAAGGARVAPQAAHRDLTEVDTGNPEFRQVAAVPLRAETHSAEDVPVYAGGPASELFHGVQEQSYLYHAMVEALGWRDGPARRSPHAIRKATD
ncbi:MAG: alkaline phosphatase [Deltaproteobacteria bacterium]|nr:alkaline phosphatase [Deltaproteobacteria bacterium]